MKVFKLVFSRLFLLILLIVLQVAIIGALVYLGLYADLPFVSIGIYVILLILGVVIFLTIINSGSIPDIKIPWIAFVLGVPVLGVLGFIFFSNRGLSKKLKKKVAVVDQKMLPYYDYECDVEKELKKNPEYVGIYKYLQKILYLSGKPDNKVTYLSTGEEFFPDLIEHLKQAEKFILMEFFIVGYGKEWSQIYDVLCAKAKEGVTVKFMYDDFGCASTLKGSFVKDMESHGIQCCRFNRFVPVLSGVFNNRDHRKICVIDHKCVYTGGINLADEYANDIVRFGYWKDSMVRIEGPAIKGFIMEFAGTFDCMYGKYSDYAQLLDGDYEKAGDALVSIVADGPAATFKYNVGEQTFINLMTSAQKSIKISSPYLIPTFALNQAMINAALRGVNVELLVPGIPDKKLVYLMAKNNFKSLLEAGVKIYIYTPGFNHEKEVIVDEQIAFIGTINLDYRSLIHHYECGALIYNSPCIKDMVTSFNDSIGKSELVPTDFKLPWYKKLIANIVALFTPLM